MSQADHRLFVISDLHLGGDYTSKRVGHARGFRICTQTERLASFIHQLTREGAVGVRRCELVINGDFFDFLAEEWQDEIAWLPFIQDGKKAAGRLSLMIERDWVVFDALKDFLAEGHALTILLGNHDVELSLPAVRRELIRTLDADGKVVHFVFDGQAYSVGPVLIEHGNRYDGWNVTDHDGLRRVRSAQSRLESLVSQRAFAPPAGSWMVATVMNHIKAQFPFVDLLKPENEATLPILLALAPHYRRHLLRIVKLALHARRHSPDEEGQHAYAGDVSATSELQFEALLARCMGDQAAKEFLQLIDEASPARLPGEEDEIAGGKVTDLLALLPMLTAPTTTPLAQRLPALLAALITLRDTRSFDRTWEVDKYMRPAERLINRGFKVVIFGHTHLAKKVPVADSVYLNTGTWADLILFPYDKISQPRPVALQWLEGFARDMEMGKMEGYIVHVPTYARVDISVDGSLIHRDIHEFTEGESLL